MNLLKSKFFAKLTTAPHNKLIWEAGSYNSQMSALFRGTERREKEINSLFIDETQSQFKQIITRKGFR